MTKPHPAAPSPARASERQKAKLAKTKAGQQEAETKEAVTKVADMQEALTEQEAEHLEQLAGMQPATLSTNKPTDEGQTADADTETR